MIILNITFHQQIILTQKHFSKQIGLVSKKKLRAQWEHVHSGKVLKAVPVFWRG